MKNAVEKATYGVNLFRYITFAVTLLSLLSLFSCIVLIA